MTVKKLILWFSVCILAFDFSVAQEVEPDWYADYMPYDAFDRLNADRIMINNSTIDIAFTPSRYTVRKDMIIKWIKQRADIVAAFYGQFPVNHLRLLIIPAESGGISRGVTYGYRGSAIKIQIASNIDQATLDKDWVLVHEMIHLAFPSQKRTHHWLEEGLATYIEPIARAQYKEMPNEEVWGQLVEGLPKGLPKEGDQGLDYTHTWGRTYWGGALFCLLADMEIRNRTNNKYGLQHALQAINRSGGNIEQNWPIEKALEIGDHAIGAPVLINLYEKMKATPIKPNLEDIWRKLGISMEGQRIQFDDHAPLAAIRRAITTNSK